MLKFVISFFVGAAVGAATALFLVPSSNKDSQLHTHEDGSADRERMRVEYQKGLDELHLGMEKMSGDLSFALNYDAGQEITESTADEGAARAS